MGSLSQDCDRLPIIHDNRMLAERAFYCYGIYPVEGIGAFRVPKNGDARNKNHLLCGWRQSVVQKNHLSVTIELFRHYCKKGKVILWRIRIMI